MSRQSEIKGVRFSHLIAIERASNDKHGKAVFSCLCDCGKTSFVASYKLRSGHTKSCGCMKSSLIAKSKTKHGEATGGFTSEYRAWRGMLSRCSGNYAYKDYKGRGISVCNRWKKFENFIFDMGRKPLPDLSLDRINNNGNYEPSNCRWATEKEQQNNKRSNRLIKFKGVEMSMTLWAEKLGIKRVTIRDRIKSGWSIKSALTTQVKV